MGVNMKMIQQMQNRMAKIQEELGELTVSATAGGGAVTVEVTYPAALSPDAQYWKYGPTAGDPTPHWYSIPATIVGNVVSFTITDGGLGDDDRLGRHRLGLGFLGLAHRGAAGGPDLQPHRAS